MVSRSSAAGNSSMPPMANMVSGNTSVCTMPALVATFSATLPATAEACGVNASRPPRAFGVGLGFGADAPLGDQQDAENADQQNGALQEQRGRVDGDGADHGGAADGAVQVPGERTTATNAAARPTRLSSDLGAVAARRGAGTPRRARRRRRRRTRSAWATAARTRRWVLAGSLRRAFRHPGCGVGLVDRGQRVGHRRIDHVQRGFRIHAEHQQQRDQRCHDRQFARHQVAQSSLSSATGPVIIRW